MTCHLARTSASFHIFLHLDATAPPPTPRIGRVTIAQRLDKMTVSATFQMSLCDREADLDALEVSPA